MKTIGQREKENNTFQKILNNTADNKLLLSEEQKVGKIFQSKGNASPQKGRQVVQRVCTCQLVGKGG